MKDSHCLVVLMAIIVLCFCFCFATQEEKFKNLPTPDIYEVVKIERYHNKKEVVIHFKKDKELITFRAYNGVKVIADSSEKNKTFVEFTKDEQKRIYTTALHINNFEDYLNAVVKEK
jgi:hypothetical protein